MFLSRKLFWYLDQSTRLNVKTVDFRKDRSGFPEITAVHVAPVQVGHLPVDPGHEGALVGAELQRGEGRVGVVQPDEDSGRVTRLKTVTVLLRQSLLSHLIMQNLPEVSGSGNVLVLVEKYFLIVVVGVFVSEDPVSSSVHSYLSSQPWRIVKY